MAELTPTVDTLIGELGAGIERVLSAQGRQGAHMVGIRTGGVWIAERLRTMQCIQGSLGTLNINFYRDDFTRIGMHPRVTPSNLPFEVQDRHIVLVDDVLYTGRTIRAALNEIFDYGRPASVTLAVLVERSGRELPIQPDIVGQRLVLSPGEYVKLVGPEPLKLIVSQSI
jgi:pyrimidine operon attenuation protein/uracil phosphoribosyltransferase